MGMKDSTVPDNSAATIAMAQQGAMTQMNASDKQLMLGLAQTGAQIMQSQGALTLGNAAINAQTEVSSERNDARLEIARMNYDLKEGEQENGHTEKMEELRVAKHQIDAEAAQGPQVNTAPFFSDT